MQGVSGDIIVSASENIFDGVRIFSQLEVKGLLLYKTKARRLWMTCTTWDCVG